MHMQYHWAQPELHKISFVLVPEKEKHFFASSTNVGSIHHQIKITYITNKSIEVTKSVFYKSLLIIRC
jgi:hypothetical protein